MIIIEIKDKVNNKYQVNSIKSMVITSKLALVTKKMDVSEYSDEEPDGLQHIVVVEIAWCSGDQQLSYCGQYRRRVILCEDIIGPSIAANKEEGQEREQSIENKRRTNRKKKLNRFRRRRHGNDLFATPIDIVNR